jgi:microcystin-dependent protein
MVRKYGGQTGPFQTISNINAPGQWVAPSEIYRQRQNQAWPKAIAAGAAATTTSSIVFVASSGCADTAVETGFYMLASGGVTLNRINDPIIFAELGTAYGVGNDINTFNIPSLYDTFIYAKGITASGTSATTVHTSGAVGAGHDHTFTRRFTNNSPPRNRSQPHPRRFDGLSTPVPSSFDGEGENCEARAHGLIPLFCTADAPMPVGSVFPVLWPEWNYNPSFPASQFFIASGQPLSRTEYSQFFELIGTKWGVGDGSSTYNIPDMRGLFLKGMRNPGQVEVSGIAASASGDPDAYATHQHRIAGGSWFNSNGDGSDGTAYSATTLTTPSSSTFAGGVESRPDNLSVMWVVYAGTPS